jgi:type-F conjugative transfer system pilin assembly protein TrbC
MKRYGDDAWKILEDAQGALKEGLPEVEDYFNHLGEMKTPARGHPAESFFGFEKKQTLPESSIDSAKSCHHCRPQSVESFQKPPQKKIKKSLFAREDRNSRSNSKEGSNKAAFSLTPSSSSKTLLVFVSLGMPDNLLKQLAGEAAQREARLVIRGLLENSFKITMLKLQELKIPVEIDPILFDLFEVKRVPTFIRCKTSPEGMVKEGHDRLSGNIFIGDALEKFNRFGDLTS